MPTIWAFLTFPEVPMGMDVGLMRLYFIMKMLVTVSQSSLSGNYCKLLPHHLGPTYQMP